MEHTKTCSCGNTFTYVQNGKGRPPIFCPDCREKRKLKTKVAGVERVCKCGKPLPKQEGKGRPKTICDECKAKYKPVVAYTPRQRENTCKNCGNNFVQVGRGRTASLCPVCKHEKEEREKENAAVVAEISAPATITLLEKLSDIGDDGILELLTEKKEVYYINRTYKNPDSQIRYGQTVRLEDLSDKGGFLVGVGSKGSLEGVLEHFPIEYLYTFEGA